jgi:hypothetical protein
MSDGKPGIGKKGKGNRTALSVPRLIGYGYLVVLLYLMIFFVSVVEIGRVSPNLSTPGWAPLIAIVLVLLLLLPAGKYVAPYVAFAPV